MVQKKNINVNYGCNKEILVFTTGLLLILAVGTPRHAEATVIENHITNTVINNDEGTTTVTDTGSITTTNTMDHGITNSGGRHITNMLGRISTEGLAAYGIYNFNGNNNRSTIHGEILTIGDWSTGIANEGNSNSIELGGSITTNGYSSPGIVNDGDENFTYISQHGRLYTSGLAAGGIYSLGNQNMTDVDGFISTGAHNANGIYMFGNNNSVSLSGAISTGGDNSIGIKTEGEINEIDISGSVLTAGQYAYGAQNLGAGYGNLTLSGSINTTGRNSYGIFNVRDSNSTNISATGLISTMLENSYGIMNFGSWNETYQAGHIRTVGPTAHAIYNHGDNNSIDMSGSVVTQGFSSWGVYNQGGENITNVSGSIETAGDYAHGIFSSGDSNFSKISGSVLNTGIGAWGINSVGNLNTINVSGEVKSLQSFAIHVTGSNNTVYIEKGARLIGQVVTGQQGTGNKLRFSVGPAKSYVFATEGPWILEDLDGRAVVQGSAIAAGIGNLETADEMQFGRLDRLNSAISRSNAFDSSQMTSWAVPYVSTGNRKADALTPAIIPYDTKAMGVVAGQEVDLFGSKADLLFQIDNNKLNIGKNDHLIKSTTARMGLRVSDKGLSTHASKSLIALVGYNHYDSTRSVLVNENTTTGETTFNTTFGGTELLLGGALEHEYQWTPKLKVHTQLQLDLSYEMVASYQESTYFNWNKRNILQASTRIAATLEREHQPKLHSLWGLVISHRNLLKGREGNYDINGNEVSFKGGNYKDTITTLSAGVKYDYKKNMTLRTDVSSSYSVNRINNNEISVKVNWEF